MARMIPPGIHQSCSSSGEREVFRRLRESSLAHNWIVLHSLDVANHLKKVSGEIDFVVIMPSKGVLCLEVKGCSSLNRKQGNWYYGLDPKPDSRGPFKQASEAMHSVRRRLLKARPDLSRIVFWSAVIFPYVEFTATSAEWHPWQVIDSPLFRKRPIAVLIEAVMDSARDHLAIQVKAPWFSARSNEPDVDQCEAIAQLLRPDFEFYQSPICRFNKLQEELKYYTDEQFAALDSMELNPRVVFVGPAGTGKTVLALEAARRSATLNRRVLFLCFNRMLGKWLKAQIEETASNLTCRTIHSFMLSLCGDKVNEGQPQREEFWEHTLPLLATDRLFETLRDEDLFDEIVIDEAQDIVLNDYNMDFLDLILKGGFGSGRWKLFGDFEKQAIYGRQDRDFKSALASRTDTFPIYSLRINCRNTPRIASLARLLGGLEPDYKKVLRPDDGINPTVIYYENVISQKEMLLSCLEEIYREGFRGKDIVVLSPKSDSTCCASGIEAGIWKDGITPISMASGGQIGYTTIHSFKGMESPVVVVTDIEQVTAPGSNALFYIAVTRALDKLYVLVRASAKEEIIAALLRPTAI